MRILIFDRFDIIKEPSYFGEGKELFSKYLYRNSASSRARNDIQNSLIVLLTFSKNSQKHIFFRIFGEHDDQFQLMDDLTKICENYAYLFEIDSNSVPLDAKTYVTQALKKLHGENNREYRLVKTPWYSLRYYITNRISNKYYKLYFTIMDAWEKFWMGITGIAIGCLLFIFVRWIISDETTIRYELGADNKIEKIVDNGPDEGVMSTINMPPEKILALLDSLNHTLKKYPDPRIKK